MPSITIEGKPQIFFSDNASDKPWRLKEKVVAVIESFFQGVDDLYIFSSKRIKNVVGDPVEVDVAFANISDPTSMFEFVQIRDRENTDGRPWIEQILGQRTSIGINTGIMVSTKKFSDQAIRLAKKFNIRLRLLQAETKKEIKEWYLVDTIGIHSPLVNIQFCHMLTKVKGKVLRFDANINKCVENSILVATADEHVYKVISLQRIFDVDVMQNESRREEFLAKIPHDDQTHQATLAIEYHQPHLYIKVNPSNQSGKKSDEEIQAISGIVFRLEAKHEVRNEPIIHRYKYLDVIKNNTCIAQAIVANFDLNNLNNGRQYICLVRNHIGVDYYNLGGALFH